MKWRQPLERFEEFALLVRADRRTQLMVVGGAGVVLMLIAVLVFLACRPGESRTQIDQEEAWRYLLVCEDCGYRAHFSEHPTRTLKKKDGLLCCPECGLFKVSWYRRGSLTLPPGGWSTSRPAPDDVEEASVNPENGSQP
ncbi:MAG: hypothetical protein ABIG44_11280 [Planctomycetota bacterium]